jgi:hypothetical protein
MGKQTAVEHFGLKIQRRKYSLKLNREEFALITTKPSLPRFDSLIQQGAYTESGDEYTLEWCERYREICLKNYDLNMQFFQQLDRDNYIKEVNGFLNRHKRFREIQDLWECSGKSGYYLMLLDEYKQAYIGKSNDIKRRIQQHWSKIKPLDRVLLPMYNEKSVFSIDFFRALDTTRIFVWERSLTDGVERRLIKDLPANFLCNRIGGDTETLLEANCDNQ